MLTGAAPSGHGVVGNGWYNQESAEIQFWKQSNRLVSGEKVWETARARDPSVTCAKMFWWFNMYSSADYSATPRPIYKADGRKIPDCYSHPSALREELQNQLGRFPLFSFWGPGTSIESSEWIANATILTHKKYTPTLTLTYLPHLDYGLQKLGPDHAEIPSHAAEIDRVVGRLLDYFQQAGVSVTVVSEYGIEPVSVAVPINRVLREAGLLAVRMEEGSELMDPGASEAFAAVDHQIAHVYVKNTLLIERIQEICESLSGVGRTLNRAEQVKAGIAHPRSGDLVLVAERGHWFSYHYWLDDNYAPDFARTVDIHRKPGYDPLELFFDPELCCPKLRAMSKVAAKKLGFRALIDVVPLDNDLVRGSHGRIDVDEKYRPVMITQADYSDDETELPCTAVRDLILDHLFPS
jgi:predicted AlkP superfamily pyrophosphatase or phosphodiesterase